MVELPAILCVDDEPYLLAALTRSLRGRFRISTAASALEALQTLETRGPFAALVSDFGMPGIDGVELMRRARERWPQMKRILLTGYGTSILARCGAEPDLLFRCLDKPVPAGEMEAALNAATGEGGAERERVPETALRNSAALPM